MPKIAVDSIIIPAQFVRLCNDWYGGQDCMLYAVSSTGNLTLGNRRPRGCDTDEKWYYAIWCELASDVCHARRIAEKTCNEFDAHYGYGDMTEQDLIDACAELRDFEDWCDEQVDALCADYGLEDWDPSP